MCLYNFGCSYRQVPAQNTSVYTPGWHLKYQHIGAETNRRHFADDIFKCIFLNENVWIPTKISLKFVPKGPINNIPALVQIMAWRRPGDKPLSEPMMVSFPTHICVARPQWVNEIGIAATLIFTHFLRDQAQGFQQRGKYSLLLENIFIPHNQKFVFCSVCRLVGGTCKQFSMTIIRQT